jgi:hypothetical protein
VVTLRGTCFTAEKQAVRELAKASEGQSLWPVHTCCLLQGDVLMVASLLKSGAAGCIAAVRVVVPPCILYRTG